jgi:hypothetical protein
MRLELTHRFAIPLQDGFDYIVEPRNWPEYWPGLIRVQPGAGWFVRRAVERTMHRTVANLEGRLPRRSGGGAPRGVPGAQRG